MSQRAIEEKVWKVINKNYIYMIENIDPDPIIKHLKQDRILPDIYHEKLRNKLKKLHEPNADVNELLFEILKKRERWWIPFIDALRSSDANDIADMIEKVLPLSEKRKLKRGDEKTSENDSEIIYKRQESQTKVKDPGFYPGAGSQSLDLHGHDCPLDPPRKHRFIDERTSRRYDLGGAACDVDVSDDIGANSETDMFRGRDLQSFAAQHDPDATRGTDHHSAVDIDSQTLLLTRDTPVSHIPLRVLHLITEKLDHRGYNNWKDFAAQLSTNFTFDAIDRIDNKEDDKAMAVIRLFIQQGGKNAAFGKLIDALEKIKRIDILSLIQDTTDIGWVPVEEENQETTSPDGGDIEDISTGLDFPLPEASPVMICDKSGNRGNKEPSSADSPKEETTRMDIGCDSSNQHVQDMKLSGDEHMYNTCRPTDAKILSSQQKELSVMGSSETTQGQEDTFQEDEKSDDDNNHGGLEASKMSTDTIKGNTKENIFKPDQATKLINTETRKEDTAMKQTEDKKDDDYKIQQPPETSSISSSGSLGSYINLPENSAQTPATPLQTQSAVNFDQYQATNGSQGGQSNHLWASQMHPQYQGMLHNTPINMNPVNLQHPHYNHQQIPMPFLLQSSVSQHQGLPNVGINPLQPYMINQQQGPQQVHVISSQQGLQNARVNPQFAFLIGPQQGLQDATVNTEHGSNFVADQPIICQPESQSNYNQKDTSVISTPGINRNYPNSNTQGNNLPNLDVLFGLQQSNPGVFPGQTECKTGMKASTYLSSPGCSNGQAPSQASHLQGFNETSGGSLFLSTLPSGILQEPPYIPSLSIPPDDPLSHKIQMGIALQQQMDQSRTAKKEPQETEQSKSECEVNTGDDDDDEKDGDVDDDDDDDEEESYDDEESSDDDGNDDDEDIDGQRDRHLEEGDVDERENGRTNVVEHDRVSSLSEASTGSVSDGNVKKVFKTVVKLMGFAANPFPRWHHK